MAGKTGQSLYALDSHREVSWEVAQSWVGGERGSAGGLGLRTPASIQAPKTSAFKPVCVGCANSCTKGQRRGALCR